MSSNSVNGNVKTSSDSRRNLVSHTVQRYRRRCVAFVAYLLGCGWHYNQIPLSDYVILRCLFGMCRYPWRSCKNHPICWTSCSLSFVTSVPHGLIVVSLSGLFTSTILRYSSHGSNILNLNSTYWTIRESTLRIRWRTTRPNSGSTTISWRTAC